MVASVAALLCLIVTAAGAQENDMIHSRFDMKDARGRIFRIDTAHPAAPPPQEGWPVIWLTDGNMTFVPAVRERPQALLVGIGYPEKARKDPKKTREDIAGRRYYDLTTPASPATIPLLRGQAVPRTGGATAHLHFIVEKLRPFIAAHFPVSADRQTLYGHSLGGFFVIHALISDRQAFRTYCAADPAIWWNSHDIMPRLSGLETGGWRHKARIRITVSGRKADRPGLSEQELARIRHLRSGPGGREAFDTLRQMNHISAYFKAFRQETHGSLLAVSVRDCLSFAGVIPSVHGHDNYRNSV